MSTHGATALGERRRHRHAGRHHDRLGEGLRALDRGRSPRRAEDRDPDRPEHVGEPRDERHLRPDDDELDVERAHEAEHGLGVVRPHGVALPEGGDAGIARERRGARRAAATGRASRRARARGHRIRRGGRAPSESTERYGSVSTASRPCPVPTSETGTPRASSTKRT